MSANNVNGKNGQYITKKVLVSKESTPPVPKTQKSYLNSRAKKIIYYVASIFTLGLGQIIYSISESIYLKFQMAFYTLKDIKPIINPDELEKPYDIHDPNGHIVDRLNKKATLSGPVVKAIFASRILPKVNNEKKDQKILQESFVKFNDNDEIMIVPIVLKKGIYSDGISFRDHIVTLIIDKTAKKIIFIDSFGKTLSNYKKHSIVNLYGRENTEIKNIEDLWKKLMTVIPEGEYDLVENTQRMQKDGYNCGMYFLYFTNRYLTKDKNESAEKMLSKPVTQEDLNELRTAWIKPNELQG